MEDFYKRKPLSIHVKIDLDNYTTIKKIMFLKRP